MTFPKFQAGLATGKDHGSAPLSAMNLILVSSLVQLINLYNPIPTKVDDKTIVPPILAFILPKKLPFLAKI